MDKQINSLCICKTCLITKRDEVVMLEPCEHMIHVGCLKQAVCPYCDRKVKRVIHRQDYKKDPQLYQKCIDILSMTNFDHYSKYDPLEVLTRGIPNFLNIASTIITESGDIKGLCAHIFESSGVTLRVKGAHKLDGKPKVYIANHTTYLDIFVMGAILDTYFLSSSLIKNYPYGKNIIRLLKLLTIDRNRGMGTTQQIKSHLDQGKPICIFPEGMFSHPTTISKFRTGAFNTGHPVQPVIIKYNDVMMDISPIDFLCKISTGNGKGVVEVTIMDTCHPPFDIEKIRSRMARKGGLLKARTSNYDIKD